MQPFLHQAADFILSKTPLKQIHKTCAIVPSRRAVGFLKRALAEKANEAFLAPEIVSIDDFIVGYSGLQVVDNLTLLFELYDCYKIKDPDLRFEKFIAWAPTVLGDFDLIDQYLVQNPAELFSYMSEVEALKRWNIESHDPNYHQTLEQYFTRYSDLKDVYESFKARLQSKGIAYRGMAYRLFAEEIENFDSEIQKFEQFYFIGLNALSKAEIVIIEKLVHIKKAACYWDMDDYFLKSNHQAGSVLRKYQAKGKFGKWNTPQNLLLTSSKEIDFYNSPNESLQAKAAGSFLGSISKGKTVLVVPDEKMIPSVLFSLGESVADFNISMGLGLGISKWSKLLSLLFEIQTNGFYAQEKINSVFILALVKDALLNSFDNELVSSLRWIQRKIQKENLLFISKSQIPNNLQFLFNQWVDAKGAVNQIDAIFYYFKGLFEAKLDFIEKEFFFAFDRVLSNLKIQILAHKDLSIPGVQLLLKELYKLEKVAFEGDPEASIQIMSLLETRCLDFENVIFLSFNEGVIPSSNKANSFLPFEACLEYGIPIYRDQDAIMNYHFLRLLMRAEKVKIIYSSSANGSLGSKSEESRFAKQLKSNLIPQNELITSQNKTIGFAYSKESLGTDNVEIEKSQEILIKLKKEISEKGLSPTSITQYLKCPLQFYFKRIVKLSSEDTLEESIGYDVYGNWIHNSLEELTNTFFKGKIIGDEDLKEAVNYIDTILDKVIAKEYKGFDITQGWNYIFRKMAAMSLKSYLQYRQNNGLSFTITGAEQYLEASIPIGELKVKLKGTIDAIEEFDSHIELIDFKTGNALATDINTQKLIEFFLRADKDKHRQLLIYSFLYSQNSSISSKPVRARIYSFRNLAENILLNVPSETVLDVVTTGIKSIIDELLNPNLPISQTKDLETCKYCDFKTICNR